MARITNHVIMKSGKEYIFIDDTIQLKLHVPLHITVIYYTQTDKDISSRFFCVSPEGCEYSYDDKTAVPSLQHCHDFFELLIVLKGKVYQKIEGQTYLYSIGSCCLINRNILHCEKTFGDSTLLFIQFSKEYVMELIENNRSAFFKNLPPINNSILTFMEENLKTDHRKNYLDFFPIYQNTFDKTVENSTYVHGRKNTSYLHRISNDLIENLFTPKIGSEYIIKGLLYGLFDYLDNSKAFHIIPVSLHTRNDELLFSRIRHLMEDTHGRISRSELEQSLHYSGNYLNSIIKKYTGMSLFEYGTGFTMNEAARLLDETDKSIGEIMTQLHFSNWGHFNQLFKKQFGMLPSQYKNK